VGETEVYAPFHGLSTLSVELVAEPKKPVGAKRCRRLGHTPPTRPLAGLNLSGSWFSERRVGTLCVLLRDVWPRPLLACVVGVFLPAGVDDQRLRQNGPRESAQAASYSSYFLSPRNVEIDAKGNRKSRLVLRTLANRKPPCRVLPL
jgi:hypothetical protein